MPRAKRDPRTKEELLDRMLRYDFDGDIRNVGATTASIVRIGANALRLTFPDSGVVFDLLIRRPREENKVARRVQEAASFRDDDPVHVEPEPVQEAPRRRRRAATPQEPAEPQRQVN